MRHPRRTSGTVALARRAPGTARRYGGMGMLGSRESRACNVTWPLCSGRDFGGRYGQGDAHS